MALPGLVIIQLGLSTEGKVTVFSLHGAMAHGDQRKIRFSQKPEVLDIEICRLPKETRIYPSYPLSPYMPCGHACVLLSGFEVARTAANYSALPSV